ncbi:hypothetical protein AMECASPLE_021320 [Ameca splendens]|uniref:Uncharacterized protein n=1 Tax=Ameca splendens TaxID=208324 RepID=A0ABV1A026_9TELE
MPSLEMLLRHFTPRPPTGQRAFQSTLFNHFCSLIIKMQDYLAAQNLFIPKLIKICQQWKTCPSSLTCWSQSDPEREENENRTCRTPSSNEGCVITVFTPSPSIPSIYIKECSLHFEEVLMLGDGVIICVG